MAQDDDPPPATVSTRGVWAAIGELRDEFAEHRKDDRDDFKTVNGKLDDHGKTLTAIQVSITKLGTKLDERDARRAEEREDKALAVRASTVELEQTEQTKRIKLTTGGKIVAAIIGLIAAALGIGGGLGVFK